MITITPAENTVEINGRSIFADLSAIQNVKQVKWYGANGVIHRPDVDGQEGPTERITSIAEFAGIIAKAQFDIQQAGIPPAPTLNDAKKSALEFVDSEAGQARARFITVIPGQEMTYLEKVTQARALKIDDEEYGAEDYPLMFAEIGITAADAEGVADVILARYAAWQQIGAVIEGTRLSAKQAIDAADSAEAVAAIIDGLSWPQPE